jgi:hypothetical protein
MSYSYLPASFLGGFGKYVFGKGFCASAAVLGFQYNFQYHLKLIT